MPLVLPGSTSGDIQIKAPAVAGSNILTAPAETGTLRSTMSSGTIIQVKNTQFGTTTGALTSHFPIDNTIPQNTEGNALTSLDTTITPTSASNWLVFDILVQMYITTACHVVVALFKDSGADAIACSWCTVNTGWITATPVRFRMTSPGTSAYTFKVRVGGHDAVGAHVYVNGSSGGSYMGGTLVSSMTITEVVP
jgi:hypothetical protein